MNKNLLTKFFLETLNEEEKSPSPTNDEDNKNGGVESSNNRIYFYGEVNRDSVLSLSKKITDLNNGFKIKKEVYQLNEYPKINLHINSYGGYLFDGFSAVNYVKQSTCPIISVIDGYAASAATLISVVAKERKMREYSFLLIHQLSSWFGGKFEELKDDMKNNQLLMNQIYKVYEEHTKIPKRKLKEILKKDIWFTPKECLEYGLIDEIII